eukprot:8781958-Alexandrium_andersonii.AAC.1
MWASCKWQLMRSSFTAFVVVLAQPLEFEIAGPDTPSHPELPHGQGRTRPIPARRQMPMAAL